MWRLQAWWTQFWLWVAMLPVAHTRKTYLADLASNVHSDHPVADAFGGAVVAVAVLWEQAPMCEECERRTSSPLSHCTNDVHKQVAEAMLSAIGHDLIGMDDITHGLAADGLLNIGQAEGWLLRDWLRYLGGQEEHETYAS
jgi:predicted metal-binding membrane protein